MFKFFIESKIINNNFIHHYNKRFFCSSFSVYEELPLPYKSGFLFKFKHDKGMLGKLPNNDLIKYRNDYIDFIKRETNKNKNSYVFSIIPTTIHYHDVDRLMKIGEMVVSDYQWYFASKPLSEKTKNKVYDRKSIVFEKINNGEFILHYKIVIFNYEYETLIRDGRHNEIFSYKYETLICNEKLDEIYEKSKKVGSTAKDDLITIKDYAMVGELMKIASNCGVEIHGNSLKSSDAEPGHLSCYTEDAFVSHMYRGPKSRDEAIVKDVEKVINFTRNNKDSKIFFSSVLVINKNLFPTISINEVNKKASPYHYLAYPGKDNCCTVFWPWIWAQYGWGETREHIRMKMNPVDFIAYMLHGVFIRRFQAYRWLFEERHRDKNIEEIFKWLLGHVREDDVEFEKMVKDKLEKGLAINLQDFEPCLKEEFNKIIDTIEYLKEYSIYKKSPEEYKKEFYNFLEKAGMQKSLFTVNHGTDNYQNKHKISPKI